MPLMRLGLRVTWARAAGGKSDFRLGRRWTAFVIHARELRNREMRVYSKRVTTVTKAGQERGDQILQNNQRRIVAAAAALDTDTVVRKNRNR